MPLVSSAAYAVIFGARQDHFEIALGVDRARFRIEETRPAGAALVFRRAVEQRLKAGGADEGAGALFVVEFARSGAFRTFLEQHVVARRRKQVFPFRFWFDRLGHRIPLCDHDLFINCI